MMVGLLRNGLKRICVIVVICYLLLSLIAFDNVTLASSDNKVSQEQAGLIIANWAICFWRDHASETRYSVAGRETTYKGQKVDGYYKFDCVGWVSFVVHQSLAMGSNYSMDFFGIPTSTKNTNDGFSSGFEQVLGQGHPQDNFKSYISKEDIKRNCKAGDLLFKKVKSGDSGHVLIYIGNGEVIHCSGGGPVKYGPNVNSMGYGITRDSIDSLPYEFGFAGRITQEAAANIDLNNVSEFAKSVMPYDNLADLNGMAKNGQYAGKKAKGDWKIGKLSEILDYVIGIITYTIKAAVLGFINIIEKAINWAIATITGEDQNGIIESNNEIVEDATYLSEEELINNSNESVSDLDPSLPDIKVVEGPSATSFQDDRITVEEIIFNKVPILDINVFNFETAGGVKLSKDSTSYIIKKSVAKWYYVILSISIVGMLFILVYAGIRMAMSTTAEGKAKYSSMLTAWFVGFGVVVGIHLYMIVVVNLNNSVLNIISKMSSATQEMEQPLYDTIRTKAYSAKFTEGVAATVIYGYLVYIILKFLFIYFKRYFLVNILVMISPFIGAKYAFDKVNSGKSNQIASFLSEFTMAVVIQLAHALVYTIIIGLVVQIADKSLAGFIISLVFLNFITKADNIVMHIFGKGRGGLAGDLANDTDIGFGTVATWFGLVNSFGKGVIGLPRTIFGTIGYYGGELIDTFRPGTVDKITETFENITDKLQGKAFTFLNDNFLHGSFEEINARAMLGGEDEDLNDALKAQIKASKDLRNKNAKANLDYVVSTVGGVAKTLVAVPEIIANPVSGIQLMANGINDITKYNIKGTRHDKEIRRYKINKHRKEYAKNLAKYRQARNDYINSQYTFEQNRINLRNEIFDLENDSFYKDAQRELARAIADGDINVQQAYEQIIKDYKDEIEKRKSAIDKLEKDRADELDRIKDLHDKIKGMYNPINNAQYEANLRAEKVTKQEKKTKMAVKAKKDADELEGMYKNIYQNMYNQKISDGMSTDDAKEEATKQVNETLNKVSKDFVKNMMDKNVVTFATSEIAFKEHTKKLGKDSVDGTINMIEKKINENRTQKAESILRNLQNTNADEVIKNVKKIVKNSSVNELDKKQKQEIQKIIKSCEDGTINQTDAISQIESKLTTTQTVTQSDGTTVTKKVVSVTQFTVSNDLKKNIKKKVEETEIKKASKLSTSDYSDAIMKAFMEDEIKEVRNNKEIKKFNDQDTIDKAEAFVKKMMDISYQKKKAKEKGVSLPSEKVIFENIRYRNI